MSTEDVVAATRSFIRSTVLPIDDEFDGDVHAAGGEDLRHRLQAAAREAGLLTPHGPTEYGGLGLDMTERAPVFEESGYSLFGPMAMNINAPDKGNIHMLAHIASQDQCEQYLEPLVQGSRDRP